MKKLLSVILVLLLMLTLFTACGGKAPAGNTAPGNSGSGGAAVINNEEPCDCCPDCDQDNCEYDCTECECCAGGGYADGKGPLTFKVEYTAHYHDDDIQDIKVSGEAIVTADQVNEDGNYGFATGSGQYDHYSVGDWLLRDPNFEFTAKLSGYDPLSGQSIVVGFNHIGGEMQEIYTPDTPSINGMKGVEFLIHLFFLGVRNENYDEETEFFNFELPLDNWSANETFNWKGDDVTLSSTVKMDFTITVTPVK